MKGRTFFAVFAVTVSFLVAAAGWVALMGVVHLLALAGPANAASQEVALEQSGTASINGVLLPIWSVRIGDTRTGEWGSVQRYGLDGRVFVHSSGAGWKMAEYRRMEVASQEAGDMLAVVRQVEFGGIEILPSVFRKLNSTVLDLISGIVVYETGGTRVFLAPDADIDRVQAETVLSAIKNALE